MINLVQSRVVVAGAIDRGRQLGASPLTIVVLDPGGHPVMLSREDGSGILRPQIAFAKAWGALGMGFSSRELGRRAELAPGFVASLATVSGGRIVPVPGGVLIFLAGELVGAVGVSGDNSDVDEACAIAGVLAAGLEPDPSALDI